MSRALRSPIATWLFAVAVSLYAVAAHCATVAVLYPDVRDPYRSVFLTILQGIEAGVNGSVKRSALAEDFSPAELQAWLREQKAEVIIALGQRGLQAAKAVESDLPVVTGALLLTPKLNGHAFTGISLAADPDRLFAQLKSLAPEVRRVFVVYSPDESGWLIALAKRSAHHRGVDLRAYEAADLRAAAKHYRDVLREARGGTDALWLPPDSTTVDERAVLPMILETAWDRHLIVFSSNPSHAQRGALFSLYPDNLALGRRLADLALDRLVNGRPDSIGILPLSELQVAVNLRTAAHLGLRLSSAQQREFHLVFPSP